MPAPIGPVSEAPLPAPARIVVRVNLPCLDAGRRDLTESIEEQRPPGFARLEADRVGGGSTDSEVAPYPRCRGLVESLAQRRGLEVLELMDPVGLRGHMERPRSLCALKLCHDHLACASEQYASVLVSLGWRQLG